MELLSAIPFLFAAQVMFLIFIARRAQSLSLSFWTLVLALVVWGGASASMALAGVYRHPDFLALLPGLWLPATPFLIVATLMIVPLVRRTIVRTADTTPAHWLVGIQVLRIFALGTLFKTAQGSFPLHVELAIGLTDLVFGVSALILFAYTRREQVSADALLIWHVVGVLIILVPGELAIQSGLPGRLQAFEYAGSHSSAPLLDFPMVLAPSLIVPLFLLLNLFGAFAAYRSLAGRARAP